jgi:hypothetical protein
VPRTVCATPRTSRRQFATYTYCRRVRQGTYTEDMPNLDSRRAGLTAF